MTDTYTKTYRLNPHQLLVWFGSHLHLSNKRQIIEFEYKSYMPEPARTVRHCAGAIVTGTPVQLAPGDDDIWLLDYLATDGTRTYIAKAADTHAPEGWQPIIQL